MGNQLRSGSEDGNNSSWLNLPSLAGGVNRDAINLSGTWIEETKWGWNAWVGQGDKFG